MLSHALLSIVQKIEEEPNNTALIIIIVFWTILIVSEEINNIYSYLGKIEAEELCSQRDQLERLEGKKKPKNPEN